MQLIRYEYPETTAVPGILGGRLAETARRAPSILDYFAGLEEPAFAADEFEDKENYYLRTDMPGVKRDQLERTHTYKFHRAITVSEDINAEKVSAKLEDGILTVTMPKQAERQGRMITVG